MSKMNKELEANMKLSHYRIERRLGAGGMGEVFLAEDTRLRRKVAIKVLPADITGNRERLQRFEQEAFAASALNHPHILTIHEFGKTDDETHFIATEFVEGVTLNQRMASDEMSIGEVLDIAAQVASALVAAHEVGIIHRDIKPENIMLRRDGYVKVLDFGLAKLTEKNKAVESDPEAETRALVNTNPGAVMGTAAYMSPEQARGLQTDARTDIWSLGVVLYEMLSGHKPFTGATPTDVIVAVVNKEPPPINAYAPNVPAEIEWIVEKALHKEPDERYQTAKELLADLRRVKRRIEFENELERSATPEAYSATEAAPTLIHTQTTTAGTPAEASTKSSQSQTHSASSAEYIVGEIKSHKRSAAIILAVLLFAAVGFSFWYLSNRSLNTKQIESIAVLPFVNESGNPDNEYLSDGMTESLIGSLSQIPNLNVKARSSVFRYKGKETDLQKVAQELNVQAILTGRVLQRGEQLLLNLELVDAATENVIWSEQYTRKTADLVALQTEIARDVSSKLQRKLTGAGGSQNIAKSFTTDSEAYQLYLKGLFHWNKRTADDLKKAIEYFNQAKEKDPTFALAYAGLAITYKVLDSNTVMTKQERNEANLKAKAAALKAIELNDTLAEPHAVLAQDKIDGWDFAEAEKEFKRAIELNPNYATAHQWYSELLGRLGRHDEALAEIEKAYELDPFSTAVNMNLGLRIDELKRFDESIAQFKKTIEMSPEYPNAYLFLGYDYIEKGMYEESIEPLSKANTLLKLDTPESAARKSNELRQSLKSEGTKGYWRKQLEYGLEFYEKGFSSPVYIAGVYARLGEKEKAFEWLEKAYAQRDGGLTYLKVNWDFDSLRSDARFQDLLRRVGLPQ